MLRGNIYVRRDVANGASVADQSGADRGTEPTFWLCGVSPVGTGGQHLLLLLHRVISLRLQLQCWLSLGRRGRETERVTSLLPLLLLFLYLLLSAVFCPRFSSRRCAPRFAAAAPAARPGVGPPLQTSGPVRRHQDISGFFF